MRSILEGKAGRVAAAMRRAATVAGFSKDTRKPVDRCADYLLKYAPYLHYDRYLAAGYPIATGVIEGACRHLVRDRMELTGARWRLVGAESVLKLRALRASGDFDAYWDFHEAREYERTTPSATRMGRYRRSPSRPHRPPHRAFDGSSNSCHAARRNPLGRRRRRAAPNPFLAHRRGDTPCHLLAVRRRAADLKNALHYEIQSRGLGTSGFGGGLKVYGFGPSTLPTRVLLVLLRNHFFSGRKRALLKQEWVG